MEIGAVSKTLGVPAPTLRRWTREFQAGLHPNACGSDGRPRTFTPRDIRILRRAKELLGDGLTYDQTRQKLSDEGLLQPPEDAGGGPTSDAEREAAERFVRAMFDRFAEPDRSTQAALASRVAALERRCAELATRLEAAEAGLRRPGSDRPDESRVAESPEPPRRGWPFR